MPDPGVIVIEDGTGISGANSYVTRAEVDAYHTEMGNSAWVTKSATYDTYPDADDIAGDKAIVRASRAIDRLYHYRWLGLSANYGTQGLDWPRTGVTVEGNAVADTTIPNELKQGVYEASLLELGETGVLTAALDRGGAIRCLKAGSVEIEYQGGASSTTVYRSIDGAMANIIKSSDEMVLG